MMEVFLELGKSVLMTVILAVSTFYVWRILLDKPIMWKSKRFWFILIGLVTMTILNYYMMNKFIRIVSITIVLAMVCSAIFRVDIKTGMIATLTSQLLTMIAETIFVIIISLLLNSGSDFIENTQFGTILANTGIGIIVILFAQCEWVKKLYHFFKGITRNISDVHLIFITIIFILGLNIFAMIAYYELDFKMMLLFNVVTMVIYFAVIMTALKNKNDYIEVYDKYNTTLSSLKEYEDIFNQYRVSNHENKNQLLTIRNMIKNKEKHIPEYIDKIVENKLKDNEYLMGKSMIIPEGGLRGLIYSKMLVMKEKNIDFDLSIDKAIRTVQLIELGDQSMLDIYRIMGVFLDNAIEAVENLEEKFIDLEMRIENQKLYISVTNNFCGNIDLEQMDKVGYSTKGKNHGYGLALVKEIIEENKLLEHKKEIMADEFVQTISIDISKLKF